ncbi:MAG: protease inhibitor I42 family protein [Kiritimatiellia bacterium]|nr:protease inhibitor I42 family protein [Lentisphaerota bacterium]
MKYYYGITFLAGLLVFACAAVAPRRGTYEANMEKLPEEQTIVAAPGETIVLRLKSNPTTGYQWRLGCAPDPALVMVVTNRYLPSEAEGRLGAGGHEEWILRALSAGRTSLVMEYLRPWERDVAPVETRRYQLLIR